MAKAPKGKRTYPGERAPSAGGKRSKRVGGGPVPMPVRNSRKGRSK